MTSDEKNASRSTRLRPHSRFIRSLGSVAVLVLAASWSGTGLPQVRGDDQGAVRSNEKRTLNEAPKHAEKPGSPSVKVPFERLSSNHMLVLAKINGKGPFRLIFDLGAPVTLLGNRAAEESGVIAKDAPRSFLFAMRGKAEIAELQIGDLTAKKVPAIVFDHPTLRALGGALGKPLDGIVGYTFFARYIVSIDYKDRTMTFQPVDHKVRDLFDELPNRMAGPRVAKRRFVEPGALFGIEIESVEEGLDARGVPIRVVLPGSPAFDAGLQPGDVLTTLDGRWTASVNDAFLAAAGIEPGREIAVGVIRGGKQLMLRVLPRAGL